MNDIMWHFAGVDDVGVPRLGHNDGREIRVGETLTVDCKPVVCEAGLHACPHARDALGYAAGVSRACAVRLGGAIVQGEGGHADKCAATERTVIAMLSVEDTDRVLRAFARWCALQVIHLWAAPQVVRDYLTMGDEALRDAACDAGWPAAWPAAWTAAWAAAQAAALDASGAAAWATAESTTRDAARAAAWAAAAARNAQNAKLESMLREAMGLEVTP